MKNSQIFVLSLLLGILGNSFTLAAFASDARVRIVMPIEGQQFAPGDRVAIAVDVAPLLHATDGSVQISGLGAVKGKDFSGTHFTADFVIPEYYAGPLTLCPVDLGWRDSYRAQSKNKNSAADPAETA